VDSSQLTRTYTDAYHCSNQAGNLNDVSATARIFYARRTSQEIERLPKMTKDSRLQRLKRLRDGKYGLRVAAAPDKQDIKLSNSQQLN